MALPDLDDFFLRLPEPHHHIILTRPRLEDANNIPPILNHDRIYPWMGAGLHLPHRHEHALRWLTAVKSICDIGQEGLRNRHGREDSPAEHHVRECPVRIIREAEPGHDPVYLGDCGMVRWKFPDVQDESQRQILIQDNEGKKTGDPTVVWSIGYYLAPSYNGRGIMSAVIKTLTNWAMKNMNVRHMRTTAMEGNDPSVKVLLKNGFTVEKTLPAFALKNGRMVGLHVLEWKAPLPF